MTKKDVALVCAGLIIVVLLCVVFLLMQGKLTNISDTNLPAKVDNPLKETKNSDSKTDPSVSPQSQVFTASQDQVEIKDAGNGYDGKFIILKNGKQVADLSLGEFSTARVMKMMGKNVYIAVNTSSGRGGYYLYSGGDSLYRFDMEKNQVTKVIDNAYFISDIAPDEKSLLLCYGSNVQIRSMDGAVVKSFPVSEKFGQFGSAYFYAGGTKLVYEAALSNPDDEKWSMFTIDIASGKQVTIAEDLDLPANSAEYALMRP